MQIGLIFLGVLFGLSRISLAAEGDLRPLDVKPMVMCSYSFKNAQIEKSGILRIWQTETGVFDVEVRQIRIIDGIVDTNDDKFYTFKKCIIGKDRPDLFFCGGHVNFSGGEPDWLGSKVVKNEKLEDDGRIFTTSILTPQLGFAQPGHADYKIENLWGFSPDSCDYR